ncbi:MAG: UbiA prenyltransferase family protein [Methanomassiliicoccales archaeon]|nr:MAG: UbiA prenyltransferase family protein [Methanomassiliicoccales archaeon]
MSESKEQKNKFTLGQKLKGHFILTRPQQLLWLDIFGAMGFYAIIARHVPTFHYLLFILCAVIADAGACTINDVGDQESDCRSKEPSRRKRPLCTGVVSRKTAKKQAYVLYAIGLILALYLDFFVFLAALFLILLSHQYSMKPLKMNSRHIISQFFWIGFGLLYYFAIFAYLFRYETIPMENYYFGLYFLVALILFMAMAETLAKDLRDLENDRAGGKITTPAHFGPKSAAVVSFIFSVFGLLFWATPYFTVYDTHLVLKGLIMLIVVLWNILCFFLCKSIYRNYTKGKARKLHKGFILTFTMVLTLSFLAGVL